MELKMTEAEITHDTFTIDNTYSSAPAQAFAAFAELEKKKRWYADSPMYEVLEYDLDFVVGGQEVLVGKMLPSTPVAGAVLKWSSIYADVEPDNRIVFSQVVEMNERRISCALISVEFLPADTGCLVRLTHQAAFFEGSDGPDMRKIGWQALLEQLGSQLSQQ
jgi:uncharacterized protein YndB with AHSA1/START domain